MARSGGEVGIYVRPSKNLFDKHFQGKMLDYRVWRGPHEMADFDKIGWKPRETAPAPK